ncbi:MAG: GUN4 domain-containing protein [Cyanobacteria bacterium P01_D01_bin.44]
MDEANQTEANQTTDISSPPRLSDPGGIEDTTSAALAKITDQLSRLSLQITEITQQLPQLSQRITQLEDNTLLQSDAYRYGKLRDYLAASNWFEADKETIRLITEMAGKADLEDLNPDSIRLFPCNALQVIDRLWSTYSQGHFGFSVQVSLYQALGGTLETTISRDSALIQRWGERLGWRKNGQWLACNDLDYTLSAPLGSHPARWWSSPYGSKMTNFFLARLLTCEMT